MKTLINLSACCEDGVCLLHFRWFGTKHINRATFHHSTTDYLNPSICYRPTEQSDWWVDDHTVLPCLPSLLIYLLTTVHCSKVVTPRHILWAVVMSNFNHWAHICTHVCSGHSHALPIQICGLSLLYTNLTTTRCALAFSFWQLHCKALYYLLKGIGSDQLKHLCLSQIASKSFNGLKETKISQQLY